MSVKSEYVSAVRREIDRYAVWEPGQPLELGDYGELHGKTFEKRGNIRDFKVAAKELSGAPALYEFTSAGTTIAEVKAEASLSTGAVESVPKLALEFKFSRENGLVIRAAQSHTIQVSNLQDVAAALWEHPSWRFHWKIIAELRTALNVTILMGRSAGSAMRIEAAAGTLEEFKIGKLNTEAGLAITGEVGYKQVGASGPLLVDLIRIRRFWTGAARSLVEASETVGDHAYERVSASLNTDDDVEEE